MANPKMFKLEHVVPGRVLRTKLDLTLDAFHFGRPSKAKTLSSGQKLVVVTYPRLVQNVNLVRVEYGGQQHEVFYPHLMKSCVRVGMQTAP